MLTLYIKKTNNIGIITGNVLDQLVFSQYHKIKGHYIKHQIVVFAENRANHGSIHAINS